MPSSPNKNNAAKPRKSRRTTQNILLTPAATKKLNELYESPQIVKILDEATRVRTKNNKWRFQDGTFTKIGALMTDMFRKECGLCPLPQETEELYAARILETPTEKEDPAHRPLFPRKDDETVEAYAMRVATLADVR